MTDLPHSAHAFPKEDRVDDDFDPNAIPLEEWEAEFDSYVNWLWTFPVIADDSRESIYEGRGE